MITTEGKKHIKRYLAGYVPTIAAAMALGIGTRAEALGDFSLQFEAARADITHVQYDFATDELVFKGSVPDDYVGEIYEVGLYSLYRDPATGGVGATNIAIFDDTKEGWVDNTTSAVETYSTTGSRVGTTSLSHTPAASATKVSSLRDLSFDFSSYDGADFLVVAVNVANTNTANIKVRFLTDSSNYYEFTTTSVTTSGYKVFEFIKSTASVTGTPSWASINEIQVSTTSAGGGASAVTWDGIRFQDADPSSLDYILVARDVLATPKTKVAGQPQDFEFRIEVSV